MSMALGALRDRKVMPDYSLVPWTSPMGKPMRIAAAAPNIPWTDLAYSLQPNGSTLDYLADADYTGRIGVEKQSFVGGLYFAGLAAPGFYAPEGSDPTADITGWREMINAGEPYGPGAQAVLDEITAHHSSYYIDHSIPPAPMLMSSGFTDDLFPADETIRFYNRTRTEYPDDAHLALFFGDFGHMRAQNKSDVGDALDAAQNAWMDYYVKGVGSAPEEGVTAYTETCPGAAPSGGPYVAQTWAKIAKGEIRYESKPAKTIEPTAGDPAIAAEFNPIGGAACNTADGADQPGTASYRLEPAPAGGYTLLGAATVIAKFTLPGDTSQVAARLLDVGPDGQETLVARGLWRPATGGPTKQVFQLHPNGWTFAEGHVAKLELLPADTNPGITGGYGRASNDQQPVTVKQLELRLPVREKPGSLGGLVAAAAERILPEGEELAADFAALPERHPKLASRKLNASGREAPRHGRVSEALERVQRRRSRRHRGLEAGQAASRGRERHSLEGRGRHGEEDQAEAHRPGAEAGAQPVEDEGEGGDQLRRARPIGETEGQDPALTGSGTILVIESVEPWRVWLGGVARARR